MVSCLTCTKNIKWYLLKRAQQKAQLQEKEKQLHSIARDREELKQKLAQLQGLLTNYLGGEPINNHPNNPSLDASVTTELASPTQTEGKGPFNNCVDKIRGEGVKKCLFLSTLRV